MTTREGSGADPFSDAQSFELWAEGALRLLEVGKSGGLDGTQLMERWRFWRASSGKSISYPAREIAASLQKMGAVEARYGDEPMTYTYWRVAPVNWIPGQRRLPPGMLEAGGTKLEMLGWAWMAAPTFGDAMGWLFWMRRGGMETGGIPGKEIGWWGDDSHSGDAWQWIADDKTAPFGAGRLGISLLDVTWFR